MRAFVVALALRGLIVNAGDCIDNVASTASTPLTVALKDLALFNGIKLVTRGAKAGIGVIGTSLLGGATTTYAIDTGYAGTGAGVALTQTCTATDEVIKIADIAITGCLQNFYQSVAGVATAANVATVGECKPCIGGTIAAAAFGATVTSCTATAACTIVVPTTLTNGVVNDDAVGANGCSGATLAAGTSCTVKVSAGYTNAGTLINTCPHGSTTASPTATATAASASTGCAANYYQSAVGVASTTTARCTACPVGKISSAAAFTATPGAVGTICDKCAANYYQSAGTAAASLVCTACPAGHTKAVMSAIKSTAAAQDLLDNKCDGCAIGYYQKVAKAAGTSAGSCTVCPAGQTIAAKSTLDTTAVTACTDCKANFWQDTATIAAATCATCAGGISSETDFNAAKQVCTCPTNFYQSAGLSTTWGASHACTACGAGKKGLAAAGASLTLTKCLDCKIAVAGDCVTGCPADHWQSAGHIGTCTEKVLTAALNDLTFGATVASDAAQCAAAADTVVKGVVTVTAATKCPLIVKSSAVNVPASENGVGASAYTATICEWNAATAAAAIKCTKCATGKVLTNTGFTALQTADSCKTPDPVAAVSSAMGATISVATAVAGAIAAAATLV